MKLKFHRNHLTVYASKLWTMTFSWKSEMAEQKMFLNCDDLSWKDPCLTAFKHWGLYAAGLQAPFCMSVHVKQGPTVTQSRCFSTGAFLIFSYQTCITTFTQVMPQTK